MANFEIAKPTKLPPAGPVLCQNNTFFTQADNQPPKAHKEPPTPKEKYRLPSVAPGKIAAPTLLSPQFAYWRLPVDPVGENQPYFWLRTDSRVYLLPVRRLTSLTNWLRTGRALGHYFIVDFDYSHTLLPGRYDTRLYLAPAHQLIRFSPDLVLDVR